MAKEQKLPILAEVEKQLIAPLFTANIQTSKDASVVITTFEFHGETFTKLTLHSVVGSQTMMLDKDAVGDVTDAFINAENKTKG